MALCLLSKHRAEFKSQYFQTTTKICINGKTYNEKIIKVSKLTILDTWYNFIFVDSLPKDGWVAWIQVNRQLDHFEISFVSPLIFKIKYSKTV
jgi:hypothetical protein